MHLTLSVYRLQHKHSDNPTRRGSSATCNNAEHAANYDATNISMLSTWLNIWLSIWLSNTAPQHMAQHAQHKAQQNCTNSAVVLHLIRHLNKSQACQVTDERQSWPEDSKKRGEAACLVTTTATTAAKASSAALRATPVALTVPTSLSADAQQPSSTCAGLIDFNLC